MSKLICFGLGYSAEHFIARFGDGFERIVGTVRGAERAAVLNARFGGRLKVIAFDGTFATPDLTARSAKPMSRWFRYPRPRTGDPVLTAFGAELAAREPSAFGRLSVHHRSVWRPRWRVGGRGNAAAAGFRARSANGWLPNRRGKTFGERSRKAVAILRLAGIYGPGRNALVQIARGEARRIVKPGQVFNRIHVADIAQAIDAAFARNADGIFNVADDEPTPPADPIVFAAQLLGRDPPPEIRFEDAVPSMSPMALSFWQECRRVRNDKLKRELGVALDYPTLPGRFARAV